MIQIRENIYPRFPGGKTKVFTLSFDDGVEQDIRLVEMMHKHKVLGTFNLNSGIFRGEDSPYPHPLMRRLPKSALLSLFKDSGMEIAVHGLLHPEWSYFPPETVLYDILEDRKNLEQMFQIPIHGCAYPFGNFNDMVIDQLKSAGIRYARTVRSTENFNLPTNWLTLDPTCHFAHPKMEEFTEQFLSEVPQRMPQMFYVWGHSYEFESLNNWDVMEKLLNTVGSRDDVWYATNIEIYDYMKAFCDLDFSVEYQYVKNPSALPVWLEYKNKITEILPGKTVQLF